MITISLCMIVKNEETILSRCLESTKDIVDEIIIIDTGSLDKTKEIAGKYTSNIYDFEWIDDFSAARNYSFSLAKMDYILWLDADDVLLHKDRLEFLSLKKTLNKKIDVVNMPYNIWVDENDSPVISIKRERLVKNSKNFKWIEPVHEILEISGVLHNCEIAITHKPNHEHSKRNLEIFEKLISKGKSLSPRSTFYYATELYGCQKYDEAILYYEDFLNTNNQTLSFYINSCIHISMCHRIKNNTNKALSSLYRSFEYDLPSPLVCYEIGYIYYSKKDYVKAIFWLELCLSLNDSNLDSGSYIKHTTYYLPCVYLSNCYKEIDDITNSEKYKQKALFFRNQTKKIIIAT